MKTYFKEIIDLGHEYYNNMPNLGASVCCFWPLETFEHTRKITSGKLATEGKMMLMPEHCGTHIDAPRHFDEHGKTVDEVPLVETVLPGHLLDLTHRKNGQAITIADLEAAEEKSGRKIGPGAATICWTGADKEWQKPGFIMDRPFVPTETAKWLVDRKISLFCTDLIGMDDPDEWWWPTHLIWLEAGICMVQQLCNLERGESAEG